VAWAASAVVFWVWWLRPEHNIGVARFALVTLVLGWLSFLQAYFIMLLLRVRRPVGALAGLGTPRVAMVVTKSPSEPFSILRETLAAMLVQDFPHDTWLADEDPDAETLAWCEAHGVQVSTRRGRADYHRTIWPRRTRCKEGNLAFFYDHYGYDRYDFVVQLDADHVPQPGYLREMLRPFLDPAVGYVSAPSICASNAGESWSARARLFAEAPFHGMLQAGYSNGWAPMCIGSHYAVRTRALRAVGGLGPDLAEDHSTSMILNAGGWRGVHAIDAHAIGAGPATFADMLTQEFQWSRSLVTILLQHTPRYLRNLRPILKFQFLFSQLLYPCLALFMLATVLVPAAALVFDMRYAAVTYPAFLAHSAPPVLAILLITWQLRADGVLRPKEAPVLSWERMLFPAVQWPWVLWGSLIALRDRLSGRFVDFRVTPKGQAAAVGLPTRVILPYAVIAAIAILPVALAGNVENAPGFYILSLINGAVYVAVIAVVLVHHMRENRIGLRVRWPGFGLQLSTVAGLVLIAAAALYGRGMQSLHYLSVGLGPYRFTSAEFMVSGAGRDGHRTVVYVFDPKAGMRQWRR